MFINFGQILKTRKDWQSSHCENDFFLRNNPYIAREIAIGGTFIPENLEYEGLNNLEIINCLKYLVENLNIKHLRIGLRLNKIDLEKQDLGIYREILEYCFLQNVKLTLNLGPIKYCGWPEYHLSQTILYSIRILPKTKSIISSDSEISIVFRNELKKLLVLLTNLYSANQLKNIVTLQSEKEGFNPFGEYKWTFDESHITEVISLFDIYLPNRSILFNSAGFFDIPKIVEFIKKRKDSQRFIVGLDYYYCFDKFANFRFYKWFDLLFFSWKFNNFSLITLKKLQKIYNFKIEVTEAQMEPWGKAMAPGNSVQSLKFVILRSSQFLLQNKGNINMYGLDRLAMKAIKKKLSREHIQMINLIKKIRNSQI